MSDSLSDNYDEIYSSYGRKIYNFMYRLTRDHHEAEDLTHETFISVFRNISSFRGESTFRTWIYSIALNKHRDALRRQERTADCRDMESMDVPCSRNNPLESLERKVLADRVHSALNSLPEKLLLPLMLVRFEGMTYQETGKALGLTVETVRMRIHRAHLLLAELLKDV